MNAYEERMLDIQEAREQGEELGRNEGLAEGEKIGEARGRSEGLAEGEASGRAAEKIEMAKALKSEGIDINTIVKVSGLSKQEVEKL